MSAVFGQLNEYFHKNGDVRVKDWPLMSTVYPTLLVSIAYVYWVKIAGPKFMESRKPFDLKNVIIVYNLAQVCFSTWMFVGSLVNGHEYYFTFKCVPFDRSPNGRSLELAKLSWWYFFSKYTELLDTIFFVLRKKQSHVSLLHVSHHGLMPVFGECN